jgi:hypothetical protein
VLCVAEYSHVIVAEGEGDQVASTLGEMAEAEMAEVEVEEIDNWFSQQNKRSQKYPVTNR